MFEQQVAEALGGQQADVFGEHREQATHQELRDSFRRVRAFKTACERRQASGNLAGDARGFA